MNNQNESVEETTTTNDEDLEVIEDTEEQDTEDTSTEESPEDKIARLEKENKTLKIQKAKQKSKVESKTPPSTVELSQMDILAIAKSDVHEEDIERVTKFAQLEGISIREALVHDDMKAILERRAEARKVAKASNTGGSAPTRGQVSPDILVANARQGKMPDPSDLDALFEAEKKKK